MVSRVEQTIHWGLHTDYCDTAQRKPIFLHIRLALAVECCTLIDIAEATRREKNRQRKFYGYFFVHGAAAAISTDIGTAASDGATATFNVQLNQGCSKGAREPRPQSEVWPPLPPSK